MISEEARSEIARRMKDVFRSEVERGLKRLHEQGMEPPPQEATEWMTQLALESPGKGLKELEAYEDRMRDHVYFEAIIEASFLGILEAIRQMEAEGLIAGR